MKQKGLKLTGKDVVSIDIGQHTTKMIVGKPGKDSITVQHAISVTTPQDSYEKGRILQLEALKKAVGGKLDSMKIRSRQALCTIESNEVITREVLVPTASESEIEKMLEFEIQQYMPIELSSYIVQSKLLEEVVEEGISKTRVLVTAVPKELAKSYHDLLTAIGLQPAVLDIQSNAVDKLFSSGFILNGDEGLKNKSVAVLDIGHSHLNVIVFENGHYRFNRFLNHGASTIDHNLANFMDLSFEEAETMKLSIEDLTKEVHLSDDSLDPDDSMAVKMRVLNIVRNTVDTWVDDIERIFKYYSTRGTGNTIDVIYLYGGTSQMKGLDAYIQDAFNIPTNSVTGLSNVAVSNYTGDASLASYLNAMGAMIRR